MYSYTSGPGSSVGIVTRYGLDGLGIESRFSAPVQTGPGGTPSLLYNGYGALPEDKERPKRGVDHQAPRLKKE
jgi:hypothetical protein